MFTHWVLFDQIDGYFLNVPTPYPLGAVGVKWWVLSKSTQNAPARSIQSKSAGSFIKNSPFTWWVLGGQIGGYF